MCGRPWDTSILALGLRDSSFVAGRVLIPRASLGWARAAVPTWFLPTTKDERSNDGLLDLQHPVQRHLCPALHVVFHFDLVNDVAFREVLQCPAQMLWRDAKH